MRRDSPVPGQWALARVRESEPPFPSFGLYFRERHTPRLRPPRTAMPSPKKKRDSAYWMGRLKKDHPAILARLKAGKLASVRAACIEAGLIHPSTRYDALMREWKKASASERARFLRDSGAVGTGGASAPAASPGSAGTSTTKGTTRPKPAPGRYADLLDAEGKLKPSIAAAMQKAIAARRMKMGAVMEEMGLGKLDPSLGLALQRRSKPSELLLQRLPPWLR